MDPVLVLSPHMDDAALSAGQFLAGRPDAIVATLFSGTPPTRISTSYDVDCGFHTAKEAMRARRREDRSAMRRLNAQHLHLDHLDHQYRTADPDEELIASELLALIEDAPTLRMVVGPLGLTHPDHVVTARVQMRLMVALPDLEFWVYEDLPSRVLYPEQVEPALASWRSAGWNPTLAFCGTGDLLVKEAAIDAYTSQLWALDRHAVLVPERFHRLWPA